MLLESEPGQKGKASGRWDQFAANQQLFGTATSYNEDLYTTKLDAGASGISVQEAERLAAEIQAGTTSNRHLAEERGAHIDDSGVWLLLAALGLPHLYPNQVCTFSSTLAPSCFCAQSCAQHICCRWVLANGSTY